MSTIAASQIIQKSPLKDQVSVYIRNEIFTGRLQPGDHIVTSQIADALGVGRGAIREALFELENEGLVENFPYRGSFVRKIASDELEEICAVRVLLETYAIKEIKNISEEDFDFLEDLCSDMEVAIRQGNYYDFIECDAAFHGYFINKASKSVLFNAWDTCSSKITLLLFSLISKNYPLPEAPGKHRALLNILREHPDDISVYEEALKNHYFIIPNYSATVSSLTV